MILEEKLFERYVVDFNKLKKYGFKKINDNFVIEKFLKDNLFKATITITPQGIVSGFLYDIENDDEFLPLRVKGTGSCEGSFVSKIKNQYENLLNDIRTNCFNKNYYIFPQSNRITEQIIKKYGDKPEFLWEKFTGSGIFRNPETKKWYLAILETDRSKIQKNKKGSIEAALLKLNPDEIIEMVKQEHFYPAYHMNKKHWITIILDDSVSDKKIMELVEKSHNFSKKK